MPISQIMSQMRKWIWSINNVVVLTTHSKEVSNSELPSGNDFCDYNGNVNDEYELSYDSLTKAYTTFYT